MLILHRFYEILYLLCFYMHSSVLNDQACLSDKSVCLNGHMCGVLNAFFNGWPNKNVPSFFLPTISYW